METNEKGSFENPYTLAEYNAFEEGTWPGGYVQLEEDEDPEYVPSDIVGEGGEGCGSNEGSGSGSGEGSGSTYMRDIKAGSHQTRIAGPHLTFDITIEWTEGIVTGEGNEYHYIIDMTHGSNTTGSESVPESRSLITVSLRNVERPDYQYTYVADSFSGYGYWVDYNTIHVCISYQYAKLPQNEVHEESVVDEVSVITEYEI